MVKYALQHGVLVLTLDDDPGARVQELPGRIYDLARAHAPCPVVIILGGRATGPVINAVQHAHRMCSELGMLISVVTHSAGARRALDAQPSDVGTRLVIHARTDTAIATALTTS
ncbi:hypothetical protein [Streptomyces sp. NPDC127574]|uniref:hypothetical protein n=1 Tax=Streptomyces sp. NPDC127574 TaxID=3345401 RepID=UPI003644C988